MVIFGTTTLVSALTIAAVMFSRLHLEDAKEALGLPKGSVRALIALILIVIFAIMVIFMYADMTVAPLKYENGTYMTYQNGTIMYEPEPLEAQIDFSKQVLTTVSTLVVAIAGFYFGTKAVATAKGTEEKFTLQISPSGSTELGKGETLTIKVDPDPDNAKVDCKIDDPKKGSISIDGNKFTFKPSAESKVGDKVMVTFSLAKHNDVSKQLEITITK